MKWSPAVSGTRVLLFLFVGIFAAQAAFSQSLRGHWRFEEGSGLIAEDFGDGANPGKLKEGPVWAAGRIGGGLSFDGVDDRVEVHASSLTMETWAGLTVCAWVKNDTGAAGTTQDIVGWWDYPAYPSWVLTHHENNRYFFEIFGKSFVTGGSVGTNWTHVAGTYDGSTMRLYVNGNQVASSPGLSGPLPATNAEIVIGSQDDLSNFFTGTIDDVRIYDGALTAQEVKDIYDGVGDTTAPTIPDGLAASAVEVTEVEFSWNPASDGETGIVGYEIFRDSVKIAETPSTSFRDSELDRDTPYQYSVKAINGNGLVSAMSAFLDVTTLPDTSAPAVTNIKARERVVEVFFDEVVDVVTGGDTANYSINNGLSVTQAVIGANGKTVALTVDPAHASSTSYELTVTGVEDIFGNSNGVEVVGYTPVLLSSFLLAHWKLDETGGLTAADSSGNSHDGTLSGGSTWTGGFVDGALELDGSTGVVLSIDAGPMAMDTLTSFTAMAWVRNHIGAGADTDDIVGWWDYPLQASWILTHHRNDQYFFEISGVDFVTGGTVSADWTHVAASFDGSTMRLFQDGVEVASKGGLSGSIPFSTSDLIIGGQGNDTHYFDGRIDDVRIYTLDLSELEITGIVSDAIANRTPDTTPPTTPANFASPMATESTVTLTWDPAVDPESGIDRYEIFRDGSKVGETETTTFTDTGLTELTPYAFQVFAVNDFDLPSVGTPTLQVITPENFAPVISIFYGTNQKFGNLGSPQFWINILGNVQDEGGLTSLSYTLNGGNPRALNIGPDERRLAKQGDFNVDLEIGDLLDGANQVIITAIDTGGLIATETVDFTYDSNNIWPLPYSVDWSTVTDIQDAVQVVDGKWAIEGDGIRIQEVDYDRVLNVGDIVWDNYQITIPITINGFESGYLGPVSVSAGFGFTMRWLGHTNDPVSCGQPRCGWRPSGAGVWYDIGRGGPLLLDGERDSSVAMFPGETWYWKVRVETVAEGTAYALKVWQDGQTEPETWNLEKVRTGDIAEGGLAINCHHSDITFGDILVEPVGSSIDTTPPTVPQNLSTTSVSAFEVVLTWDPSEDLESGVDHYDILRDGIKVGESATTSFTDSSLISLTGYDYTVVAVNGDAVSSAASTVLPVTTLKLDLSLKVEKAALGSFMELTVTSVAGARIRLERSDSGYAGPWVPVDPALPVPLPAASAQVTESAELQAGDTRLYRAVEITDP